jgi:hypothetical protein
MTEIKDSKDYSYDDFEPLTVKYLDSLEIPQEFPPFEHRESVNSTLSLYDWDKINYMDEAFNIPTPDAWIEKDREFVVATFVVLQSILAYKSAQRNLHVQDLEGYREALNDRIKDFCLVQEGQEYFSDYSTKKLSKEELVTVLYYLEHFLSDSEK